MKKMDTKYSGILPCYSTCWLCSRSSCKGRSKIFEAGTYIGTGNNGEVEVQIVFTDSEIMSVEVVSLQETAGPSDAPIADIPQQIVERRI